MAINADKPHLWKADIAASVDLFNQWFLLFAPKAYRDSRAAAAVHVEEGIRLTRDLTAITPGRAQATSRRAPVPRMSTCPPLARDRLVGLADASKNLVKVMEEKKAIPKRMRPAVLQENLARISDTIGRMLDLDIFPWVVSKATPTEEERHRASTIVADRLCGAVSDPIIRNAQEKRQLAMLAEYLEERGYRQHAHPAGVPLDQMEPGTFAFRMIVIVGAHLKVNIPIDVVIQRKMPKPGRLPILIEAKSAGDFTNTNKRRKEEAVKIAQLQQAYGKDVEFILFLCGYFHSGYLGYEAAEGIDWIWEHRIGDLDQLGI